MQKIKSSLFFLLIELLCAGLFAEGFDYTNGAVIKTGEKNGLSYMIRKHEQTIDLSWCDPYKEQLAVYDSPFNGKLVGNLDSKAVIQITELYIIKGKSTWLKVKCGETEGYVHFLNEAKDYYADGTGLLSETIESGPAVYHCMNLKSFFIVYTNLRIRDKPGLEGNQVGLIKASQQNEAAVTIVEITAEEEEIDGHKDHWAKVNYKGVTGWVYGGYLEMECGGIKYILPNTRILYDFNLEF